MTYLRSVIAFVGLGVALILAPAPASADTCPGQNGRIAVVVDGDAGGIDLVGTDGPIQALVQSGTASPAQLSFSCDGRKLIYQEYNEANVVKVRGDSPGESVWWFPQPSLPSEPTAPVVSPSDPSFFRKGEVVFSSDGNEPNYAPSGTYTLEEGGTGLRRLFSASEEAVSSDGRWFIAGYEGQPFTLRNRLGRTVNWSKLSLGGFRNPSFSPNGNRVVFQREGDLLIEHSDGTHQRQLTTDGLNGNPVFSPDGHWIAFSRGEPADSGFYNEVVEMSLGRHPRTKVVAHLPEIGELAWAAR